MIAHDNRAAENFDVIVCGGGSSGSVTPDGLHVTAGNTMVPCIIIGEQAAAFIQQDYGI